MPPESISTSAACAVNPAQIDGQCIVDEDPQVVVAGEAEDFPALVGKGAVKLKGNVIVVVAALVAEQLAVDGKKALFE